MKELHQFFLALSNTKNVSEQYIRVESVFQQVWCNLYGHFFVGPKKSRTKFFKKKAIVQKKNKILAHFFSYHELWQTLSIFLSSSTMYLGNHSAGYKIMTLAPKRLFKTQIFWKKAIFSVKKCICPMFSQIVEFDKHQKTIHKSQKDILTINVEVLKFFFRT